MNGTYTKCECCDHLGNTANDLAWNSDTNSWLCDRCNHVVRSLAAIFTFNGRNGVKTSIRIHREN